MPANNGATRVIADAVTGHHLTEQPGVGEEEIINLQPGGSQAKSHQVKQVRDLILKYQLETD